MNREEMREMIYQLNKLKEFLKERPEELAYDEITSYYNIHDVATHKLIEKRTHQYIVQQGKALMEIQILTEKINNLKKARCRDG